MAERAPLRLALALLLLLHASAAFAQAPTPGYPERVLQWTVKHSETCDDIAEALYGSARHRALVERYNAIRCDDRRPLPEGTTLVVPERPTTLPTARLRSLHPDVRARSPGTAWAPAAAGMPLYERHSVSTLEKARADILFVDRTRVVLGEHTLVVIYDTAKRTNVARTMPSVELETGEVQAGLAALRGKPFEVGAQGGRVSGASRDTVLRSKATRATVSVFDGSARVGSAGKQVDVPKNHGTSFRRAEPPTQPRPLPAAPRWTSDTSDGLLLAEPGQALIVAGWDEVPKSARYRIEVARDPEFSELVVREEVPANVRAFRAEKLPVGAYYLRVRAIDTDDFLGIASAARAVMLVEGRIEGGRGGIQGNRIVVSRYGSLRLFGFEGLELSIDGGAFARVPQSIDPLRLAPREITLRMGGMQAVRRYRIEYPPASALIATERRADVVRVNVRFEGLDGVDIERRVAPALWVTTRSGRRRIPLRRPFSVELPGSEAFTTLHVVDARGTLLGRLAPSEGGGGSADPVRRAAAARSLGVTAPLVPASPLSNVEWWAPTRAPAVVAAGAGYVQDERFGAQLSARGSGSLGTIGLDALIATPEVGGPAADGSAWLRLRWRSVQTRGFELGPAAELGVPLTTASPPARAGIGVAIGSAIDGIGWLANVGARAAVSDHDERLAAPAAQGYLLGGSVYAPSEWLAVYALLDLHALDHPEHDALAGRGGFTLGSELGGSVFGGLALRASPWDDAGGIVSGQLTVGIRDRP